MNNRKQTKKWIILACLVSVCLLMIINTAISINPHDSGGCISVTFDKLPMLIADRIVIQIGAKSYEVTDKELVHQIISETMCATNTDLCNHQSDRRIDVYCGDTLVRSMIWETNHDGIIVYNAGMFHWVFPSNDGSGLVYPSEELLQKLEDIIEAN